MHKIIMILLSDFDMHLISRLKTSLESTFDCAVEIRQKIGNLRYAYNRKRKQYISPTLLSHLNRVKRDNGDKILGVVNVDLYSPGYDFVYGEADVHCGVATLSTFRLISENPDGDADEDLFEERVIREATHEVGHLFGMDHCKNQQCLMRTCTCVSEVDEAGNLFCNECEKKLKTNLDRAVASHQ